MTSNLNSLLRFVVLFFLLYLHNILIIINFDVLKYIKSLLVKHDVSLIITLLTMTKTSIIHVHKMDDWMDPCMHAINIF